MGVNLRVAGAKDICRPYILIVYFPLSEGNGDEGFLVFVDVENYGFNINM